MVKYLRSIVFVLCLIVLPAAIFAQTDAGVEEKGMEYLLFEEIPVVASSSFFKTTAIKAPGYSTILDMDKLKSEPISDLGYLLDSRVPGMNTSWSVCGVLLGARGVMTESNSKTLVMLDGQSLNYRYATGYSVSLKNPMLGDLKTIEVVLGPGALVHGSSAINGFINMIPRTGTDSPGWNTNIGYEIRAGQNLYETTYGTAFGPGRDLLLYAGYVSAEGFRPKETWRKHMPAYATSLDTEVGLSANAGEFYSNGQHQNYKLASYLNYDDFKLNIMFESLLPNDGTSRIQYDFNSYMINHILTISPRYTFNFSDNNSLELVGGFDNKDEGVAFWGGWNGAADADDVMDDVNNAVNEQHWEIKPIYRNTMIPNNSIAIGALYGQREFNYNNFFFDDASEFNEWPLSLLTAPPCGGGWDEWAMFLEDVWTPTEQWTISLGIRYDAIKHNRKIKGGFNIYFENDSAGYEPPKNVMAHTSPRAAVAYAIDESTVIKGSYQQGFRTPELYQYTSATMYNRYMANLGLTDRFPELKPETMDSFEVNLHKDFVPHNVSIDLNLFHNTYHNMLSYVNMLNPVWYISESSWETLTTSVPWWWMNEYGLQCAVNIPGRAKTYGGELVATYAPTEKVVIHASYGLTGFDNIPTVRYPHQTLKLGIEWKFLNDKAIFYVNNVTRSSIHSEKAIADEYWDSTGVSTRFDFSLSYALTKNITAKVSCINAFKDRAIPVGYEMNTYYASKVSDASLYYLNLYLHF